MSEADKKLGRVVRIINNKKLAINKGYRDGVQLGHRFLIYELTEDIQDFDSKESLGSLEIAKGTGTVINVQEKLSLIQSDTRGRTSKFIRNALGYSSMQEEIFDTTEPFDSPELGDFAKPV
ncbi:hypothetical protein [Solidesulfovibrio sp. C21]|uniref:hypothetical protein n=1 Tax=Solidesulfovibrio sp. C21 TaxID=3398613 RepID=UPI0039FD1C40